MLNQDGTDASAVPNSISPGASTTFSADDDLFMIMGGANDMGIGGTWFFDVYTNKWYHASVPWGTTKATKVTYDTKYHKYLKLGSVYQARDLYSYDSSTGTWTAEPGWASTTLSAAAHNGDTTITVNSVTGAEARGSIVIALDLVVGDIDSTCQEGHYAWLPMDIVSVDPGTKVITVNNSSNYWTSFSVNFKVDVSALLSSSPVNSIFTSAGLGFWPIPTSGTTVTLIGPKANEAALRARTDVINSVTGPTDPGIVTTLSSIPIGTTIQIYPTKWPHYPISGYSVDARNTTGTGPSLCTGFGPTGAFDDIHNKNLFFIVRRDTNKIDAWAYDLGTQTWQKKTGSGQLEGHRGGDVNPQWMHSHNAVIMVDAGSGSQNGTGVSTKVRYYRYSRTGVTIETPANVSASVDTNHIALRWDAVSGATGYYVYRANPTSGIDPRGLSYTKIVSGGCRGLITGTSCTDATATSNHAYHYRITAYNGSVESALSLVARGVPKLIWDGYVSVVDRGHQTVNWTPRDTNVVGYNVYRAECGHNAGSLHTWTAGAIYYASSPTVRVTGSGGWTQVGSSNVFTRSISGDTGDLLGGYGISGITDNGSAMQYVYSYTPGPGQYYNEGDILYIYSTQIPPTHTYVYTLTAPIGDTLYSGTVLRSCIPRTFSKISGLSPIRNNYYADTADMTGSKQYAYRVTSVNKLGVEGGPSPFWITIPREVRHLNWKQTLNGKAYDVQLKWDANPEVNLQGYHVYRMKRIVGGPATFTKLTSSPVTSTSYTHSQGVSTFENDIGYYVVAVDALGQEGIPSNRAFVNRSFLSYWTQYGYLNDYNRY